MKFKGEYKITIEDSGDKSIKKKDYEYEENRMKDWIKEAVESEIEGKITVEKIKCEFTKETKS